MRCPLLLVALAVLAVGGQAAQPMTRKYSLVRSAYAAAERHVEEKEVLDLFFKSASARHKFDRAIEDVQARLGVAGIGPLMSQWRRQGQGLGQGAGATSGVLKAPWETPLVMHHVQRVLGDGLNDLIEKVRSLVEAVAEPLKIERIDLTQSNPLVNSVGEITQMTISKLSTFNILESDVDAQTVSAKIKVDFEKLDAHGMYNVDATASDQLHVFGNGRFDVRLYKPTVEVFVQLGYEDEHFSVQELDIFIKLEKLKVVISNFLGGGEVGDLVCGIISDVGPSFLDLYRDEVNEIISTEVKETANALLNKLPINKIIDWIMGGGGSDDKDDSNDKTDN